MRRLLKWIPILMLIALAVRAGAYTIPYESWMGAYVGESKIGWLSYKIDKAEFEGVQGYRIASVLNNRLTVLGADLTQLVTTVVNTDANYTPLMEDFTMSSGGKTTRVCATFKKDTIECTISAGSGSSTQTIPIPAGANLVGDAMFALVDPNPEIGKTYDMHYFNPLTLAVDELKVKVERKEKITVGGKDYDCVVLTNSTPMGDMTVWQDTTGEVIQCKAMMGITMVKQSRDQAMQDVGGGSASDFAVLTSVKPSKPIASPRSTKKLELIIQGLDSSHVVASDGFQTVTHLEDKSEALKFSIVSKAFDPAKSVRLPILDSHYADCLASTAYIDSDLAAIKDQSKAIVGGETNAYRACAKIRAWIYGNLSTRADIGITRCASDVLKSKVGVCRDYAILFVALARAAGIPAKVASGLLYTEGAFYYHAWAECYVGDWIPFDATMPTDFVDATHVKFAEGDATTMFGLSKVIGNLKIDVKGAK